MRASISILKQRLIPTRPPALHTMCTVGLAEASVATDSGAAAIQSHILPGDILPGDILPGGILPGDILPSDILPGDILPGD